MTVYEFRASIIRCGFLLDWQRERLLAMIDSDEDDSDFVDVVSLALVVDNILWRIFGVGLESMPVYDRLNIKQAMRDVVGY